MSSSVSSQPDLFEALMDAAVDAIIIIDATGTIQRFNPSAQVMFGYSEAEAVGSNVRMLMPEPHRARHDGYISRHLATGEAAIIGTGREELGLRKNGEEFPMRLSVGKTRLGPGTHFVGIIHDRSQQRKTENQVRHLEQQLFHADRLVTLGELTAGIAHEISQPLTAIAAYADAAAHMVAAEPRGAEPGLHTICTRISEQSRRAAAVVDRLRHLVRRDRSKKAHHDLNKIIQDTLLLFEFEAKQLKIFWHIDSNAGLPLIFVDEIQIQQILVNLVKNSVDALRDCQHPDGRIRISVAHGEEKVTVSVEDNGPGVTAESLPRLFEPFYTTKPNGVGLGLSICKNIASAHGGQLVHSRPEQGGCSFILTLPLASIG